MAKKRIICQTPRIDRKFSNFDEVTAYMQRLAATMSTNQPNLFQGDVIISDRPPTDADGKDGDVWVEHETGI